MVPKQSFRALIQRVGLDKVKNSPKQRIATVAQESLREQGKSSVGPSPTSSFVAAAHGSRGATTDCESPPQTPSVGFGERKHRHVPLFRPYSWVSQGGANGNLLALMNSLQRLRLQVQTTANVRLKLQQAFQSAVSAYEQFLASATSTLDASPSPGPSVASAYSSRSSARPDGRHSAGEPSHTAAFYLDKVHATYEDARRYYSAVPFDRRWDDILGSLAVLGRVSRGNTVVAYHDSALAFKDMWRAVDTAQRQVHWQTYICKDDFIGQSTVRRLVEAHQRGCDTELLYDCGGNISGRARLTEELKQCGAKVIPYRPFFRSVLKYFARGLDWRLSPGLRNHRKILLVDDAHGFCGGLNIGNEYCGKAAGGTGKFRDTHCSVAGPAVAHLAEVYRDTKQPHPWKYGWRRWRQIASLQIARRVEEGRARVERTEWYRAFQAERRRSGRRLQDVPSASVKVMRVRWQKQKMQLLTLMQWNKEGTTDADFDVEAAKVAQRIVEEQARASKAAASETEGPGAVAGATAPPTESNTAEGAAARAAGAKIVSPGEGTGAKGSGPKTSAMRRKLMAARRDALYRATDLPHKRAYTDLLRRMPLLDTEPVPEAEMYLMRRQPTTQILSCNPRYRDYSIQYALWQVTRKCHRRIWITTPYYLPTRKLFAALLQAARRGVDVRVLAGSNQTTDPWFMWHASNYITERLLSAGVKIYEFKGEQIMHAKTVVVDSMWSSIGSYNWDLMSNRNLEVCLCHLDLEVARSMEAQFLKDLGESVEVRLEDHKQRSAWLRFTSWLFYNFVFLLDRITFRAFSNEDVVDVPGVPRD